LLTWSLKDIVPREFENLTSHIILLLTWYTCRKNQSTLGSLSPKVFLRLYQTPCHLTQQPLYRQIQSFPYTANSNMRLNTFWKSMFIPQFISLTNSVLDLRSSPSIKWSWGSAEKVTTFPFQGSSHNSDTNNLTATHTAMNTPSILPKTSYSQTILHLPYLHQIIYHPLPLQLSHIPTILIIQWSYDLMGSKAPTATPHPPSKLQTSPYHASKTSLYKIS